MLHPPLGSPSSGRRRALLALLVAGLAQAACSTGDPSPGRNARPGGGGGAQSGSADLVLLDGRIVTVDDDRPEAEALAVRGDRIVAVGSSAEIREHVGPATRVIDLAGRLAIPGFIEGHGHLLGTGEAQAILALGEVESWEATVALVAEAAGSIPAGEWIRGRGWHQEKWTTPPEPAVEGNPVHASLTARTPSHPVYLVHASGHAAFANARALELAEIGRETPDPVGGEIVRGPDGEPTGLLRETAQALVERVIAEHALRRTTEEREAEARRMVELAGREALSKGVTSFHDAGVTFDQIEFYRRLAAEGALPVRIYAMVRVGSQRMERESIDSLGSALDRYRMIGMGDHFLTVRSIKRQVDGALGAHGAWLLEPYSDLPRSTGHVLEPVEEIARTAELAVRHGYQLNTHAIGDRANREILDLYERIYRTNPEADLRWRIEHAQHLHPRDIPRFAELGVIASMQGVHATSDGGWVPIRIGEERTREGAYVWQSLWRSGALVSNGTDTPVEPIDPIHSFHASVARVLPDGSVFGPDERMTREQALRSYTINNAYAAFEEELKGSLTPGKLADIVVLSRDILNVRQDLIPGTRVDYTILGGEVRYARETDAPS